MRIKPVQLIDEQPNPNAIGTKQKGLKPTLRQCVAAVHRFLGGFIGSALLLACVIASLLLLYFVWKGAWRLKEVIDQHLS